VADVEPETPWYAYVLLSAAETETYVGITTDLDRRLGQHNGEEPGGARSTTRGRPWRLGVSFGPYSTRAEAQRVEWSIKRRRGHDRLAWSPD
jgi:putative endonuclease